MLTGVGVEVQHHGGAPVAGPQRGEAGLRGGLLRAGGGGGTLGQDPPQVWRGGGSVQRCEAETALLRGQASSGLVGLQDLLSL